MLLQRADVAMYQAKEGRTGVERYVPELDGNSVQRLALAGDLRTALEREEFVLHYQPKVDLRTSAVVGRRGAGALGAPRARLAAARRVHPAGRAHRPHRPADQLRARPRAAPVGTWRAQGLDIGVAVNLSARTLLERDLPDRIEAMCQRWGVPTKRLVLEITESMVVADPARALRSSRACRAGRRDRRRRLRHRLLVAGVPQAPAGRRGQDRPVVRHDMATTPATRPSCAPRSTWPAAWGCGSWPRASRRPTWRAADRAGLRSGAGLLVLARAPRGRVRHLADRARAQRAGAQRVTAASAAGRSGDRDDRGAVRRRPVERGPATTMRS